MTVEGLRRASAAASIGIFASFCGAMFLPSGWAVPLWILFLGSLVAGAVVSRQLRRREAEAGVKPSTERSLAFVAILATSWAVVDAFILAQGAIAMVLFAVALLYLLPRAILAYRSPPLLRLRLGKALITAAIAAVAFGIIRFNAYLAHDRAEQLIAAAEQFRSRNARYPDTLQQMVPDYIAAIPRPKYVLVSDGVGFDYSAAAGSHTLTYTALPPYGRMVYSFERQQWRFVD